MLWKEQGTIFYSTAFVVGYFCPSGRDRGGMVKLGVLPASCSRSRFWGGERTGLSLCVSWENARPCTDEKTYGSLIPPPHFTRQGRATHLWLIREVVTLLLTGTIGWQGCPWFLLWRSLGNKLKAVRIPYILSIPVPVCSQNKVTNREGIGPPSPVCNKIGATYHFTTMVFFTPHWNVHDVANNNCCWYCARANTTVMQVPWMQIEVYRLKAAFQMAPRIVKVGGKWCDDKIPIKNPNFKSNSDASRFLSVTFPLLYAVVVA